MEYEEKFRGMAQVGHHASRCLYIIGETIQAGWSTQRIDSLVSDYAKANDLRCATLGYKGFPAHCCTSVNHVVCHGIPSPQKILKDGDLIKVDVTFINSDGWHGDTCRTYQIGDVSIKAKRVTQVTLEALKQATAILKPGVLIKDIGIKCEDYVRSQGMSIVENYCGHGIGQEFHTLPPILHHRSDDYEHGDMVIEEGMCFTIEPMVNVGKADVKELNDGWTVVTRDRSLSAQFEYTIGIIKNGHTIFTPFD